MEMLTLMGTTKTLVWFFSSQNITKHQINEAYYRYHKVANQ